MIMTTSMRLCDDGVMRIAAGCLAPDAALIVCLIHGLDLESDPVSVIVSSPSLREAVATIGT
jgi:hypothetical protein